MLRHHDSLRSFPTLVGGLRFIARNRSWSRPQPATYGRDFGVGELTEDWSTLTPTVLIATTTRWFPTARLVVALANAGFTVDAVCPSNHPLAKTGVVRKDFRYRGLNALPSFADAITAAKPDLIVAGDDLATQHLQILHDQETRKGLGGAQICRLIERSLGAPESFSIVNARTKLMELAESEGVRVPKTAVIRDQDDLVKWIEQTSSRPS